MSCSLCDRDHNPFEHAEFAPNPRAEGYVVTDTGRVLVQIRRENEWGFSLSDDDQEWPGGLGIASSWELVSDNDPRISDSDRERLGWMLDE